MYNQLQNYKVKIEHCDQFKKEKNHVKTIDISN